ncbi:MAG: adenylate cyclase, partial [Ilumatobacter sp.]|nr:adenylate cyclase [Ilumatobacter sp.]
MLVDDGVIVREGDEWTLTIEAEAVEVPPTIQSLLAARLDRMPPTERRLIELASVVGPEFALGAVASISEEDPAALRASLDRLRRRELVDSTGLYWGDEPLFRFHHVLIRDAAYRRLLKRTRADLHLRVGDWTERTAHGLPGEHEVAIAHHYEQAHEYRRQLDDVDDTIASIGHRAAELFSSAAHRALGRDDLTTAAALAQRALDRLDDGDPLVPAMLVVAAEASLSLGDIDGGRPFVARLQGLVDDDRALAAWAQVFVAQVTMLTEPDRLHQAEEHAEAAAAAFSELGDESGLAKARLIRASTLARLGQIGRCEAELDLALTAARSAGDRRRVAAVLGAAPVAALWGPSPIPRAGGRCLDVIRLLRITTGSPAVEATSVRCQAVLEALRGRFDTARSMLTDARARVEELGLRHALNETDLYAGIVELLADDPVAAEPPLRSAYHGLGRLGIGADAGQAAAYLARALLQQGRLDEAEALADESAELAGENPQTAIAARTAQAEILAARGRFDEAVQVATEAVARAEGTDIIVDHAQASAVLARVAAQAGDHARAERAASAARSLYDQKAATVATPTTSVDGRPSLPRDQWNRGARLSEEWMALWLTDEDEHFRRMTDDVRASDHRPMLAIELHGREQARAAFSGIDSRRTGQVGYQVLATRHDDLVLNACTLMWGRGRDGPVVEFLGLQRWNSEDCCDISLTFDVGDLDGAMAELDRLAGEAQPSVDAPAADHRSPVEPTESMP